MEPDSSKDQTDACICIPIWLGKHSGIGYHYVVLENGTIQKGRWADNTGAHVRGRNKRSLGVCRIGGMDKKGKAKEDATPEQMKSIRKLSRLLAKMYNLPLSKIKGHNEYPFVKKSCPLLDMKLIRE